MAFSLTPKHTETVELNELSAAQYLVLAKVTAEKLEWKVTSISEAGLIAYTNKGMFTWNAEIKIVFEVGTALVTSTSTGSELADMGRNRKTILKFLETFEEVKPILSAEECEIKYEELKTQFVPPESDVLKLPPPTTSEKISGFFSMFIPQRGFVITPILMDLNILIFIIMLATGVHFLSPDSGSLIKWGANFGPSTLNGEWWRLITSCFLHIGIFHLVMNMYALLYIGVLLEPYLGKLRFTLAYLLTGITASMTSVGWHEINVSAGASGAIFGMYGVFLAMLSTDLIDKAARQSLLTSISLFVGYNLLAGLSEGVDNAAHIGGLVGGLVIGFAFIPSLKNPEAFKMKYITLVLISVFVLGSSFIAYKKLPNDIITYEKKIQDFINMEAMAMEVYSMPATSSNAELLYGLKERGIYFWNENIKLIDRFDEMDLPATIDARNALLREYCELRIRSYELQYKAIDENTEKYKIDISNLEAEINRVVEEVKAELK